VLALAADKASHLHLLFCCYVEAPVVPSADCAFYLEDGHLRQPEGGPGGVGHAGASAPALALNQGGN
jgi:hypothetical protein